jgi:hypothetical protein
MKRALFVLLAPAILAVTALSPASGQDAQASPHNTEAVTLKVLVKTRVTPTAPITTKRVALPQDPHGRTDRHYIQPGAQVPLEVTYPNARGGEEIIIQVLDGGTLPNGQMAMKLTLDEAKTAGFEFRSLATRGVQRVLVRKGRDEKIINLWAGADLPLREEPLIPAN